ncbi:MAG: FAD-dependent oxidoreductase [Candidatus Sumerlaeia bacterium]|nr:FAD-dependent oxidoreductase [Candidatus Sumerlaeia bacterium]
MIEPWRKDLKGRRAVVVGAGLGGLCAAASLALRGARVTVFEAAAEPGGRLAGALGPGPAHLSWPRVLTRLWSHADLRFSDFVQLRRVDPPLSAMAGGEKTLELWSDPERFRASLAALDEADAAAAPLFARRVDAIGRRADRAASVPRRGLPARSPRGPFARKGSAARLIDQSFRHPAARRALRHLLLAQGLHPESAPRERLELLAAWWRHGAWFPEGGWPALLAAVLRLAEFTGVRIETRCRAAAIVVRGGKVRSVRAADGAEAVCDLVVANAHPLAAGALLEFDDPAGAPRPPKLPPYQPGPSATTVLLKVPARLAALRVLTLVPSRLAPEEETRQVFHWRTPPSNPTVEIVNHSRIGLAEDAPPPEHAWLAVRFASPAMSARFRWDADAAEAEQERLLAAWRKGPLKPFVEAAVEVRTIAPPAWADAFSLPGGALWGVGGPGHEPAAGRFPNAWPGLVGLYLAGAACHPGPDPAQVVQSGILAAELAAEDLGG